ncbi:uncharacterized protein ASPGLDRAFT_40012 [Aspergillus glaucus CBS 516.65]|uniref:Uncharacterized protein n=1 Tax=Aspergillus glaucus CBS 516.65 TaxID=1160497 RepID=A0A1L9V602_ASPGL|nr:hypothetical protein ASPGLDRAFT_40012 [Aspergillus glaucus CBS 516.65]OJJ79311.1 hypothetical protein ASPGLDRAFT_40012 [Aspergillus glaucus CBS 516.65]
MTKVRRLQILCFVEGKRTSRSQSYSTKAVEQEALDYCKKLFASNQSNSTDFVYAGTLVGVHLRLWIVHRANGEDGMSLTPLWVAPYPKSNEDYKDLGDSADGQEVLRAFHGMISVAPQPWIETKGIGVVPSSGGGAFQLPTIDRPDFIPESIAPVLPSVPTGPTISGLPPDYVRVTKFLVTTTSYTWMTSSGETGSGRVAELDVERCYLLNKERQLYADSATENVPVRL